MPKLVQICAINGSEHHPRFGVLVMFGLGADGSVWKLYSNSQGDLWVPLKAATYSSVAAVKQAASGDQ